MKDTIRLKQSNKAALEATGYNDANEAIASLVSEKEKLESQLRILMSQSSTKATSQSATWSDEMGLWQPDEAYWARLRDEVGTVIRPPTKAAFFTASAPIKTIGKIEPEERLEEPVGRQGRDVR